jgi:hypothetical protein
MTGPLRRLVARLIASADEAICAADGETAERAAWQITPTGFGARSYRDPRFDRPRRHDSFTDSSTRQGDQ